MVQMKRLALLPKVAFSLFLSSHLACRLWFRLLKTISSHSAELPALLSFFLLLSLLSLFSFPAPTKWSLVFPRIFWKPSAQSYPTFATPVQWCQCELCWFPWVQIGSKAIKIKHKSYISQETQCCCCKWHHGLKWSSTPATICSKFTHIFISAIEIFLQFLVSINFSHCSVGKAKQYDGGSIVTFW